MVKCVLFGENFSIPDSYVRYFVMNKRSWEASEAADKEFNAWYKKCSGIDDVMKGYDKIASALMEKYAFNPLFKQLADLDIYDVSEEMYIRQVVDLEKIDDAYEYVESDLEEIIEDRNEMMQYRAARKANRGRFVGGGFGISGAIKGSVKAGTLNAATGLAHGAVNTIGNIGSAVGASIKKATLYNDDTRETLNTGIYLAIGKTFENHMQLVNSHIRGYYKSGFDPTKALALFENAKKLPAKREELLLQAVQCYPDEHILSYIFINYPEEKGNVYRIGQLFEIDFGKYIEESFAKAYTESARKNPQMAEKIKADIVREMNEYGIKTSATLTQLNRDMLVLIIEKYQIVLENEVNDSVIKEFRDYDAPKEQKKDLVREFGIWELAKEYGVQYSAESIEQILERYYSDKAKNDEDEALKVKKKLQDIMKVLSVPDSSTFNQLEKDCIKRLCGNIDLADEAQCNSLKQQVAEYSALAENKQEFFDAIQARIEAIWSKEDGEIFDNVYMGTNIYDQNQIQEAIKFIQQKGRTSSSQKYITALESCTPRNIKKAKQYQKKNAKVFNVVGIILLLMGLACIFIAFPAAVIAIPGIILMVSYSEKKKMWKILTIDETQIHSMLLIDRPIDVMQPSQGSVHEPFIIDNANNNTSDNVLNDKSDIVPINSEQTDQVDKSHNNIQVENANSSEPIEKARIEAECRAEEMTRTFNGVLYSSIEEMNVAKKQFEEQEEIKKKQRTTDIFAIVSIICSIATFPLVFTLFLWLPAWVCAIVFGIVALVKKTRKKGLAITGLIFAGIFLAFAIWAITLPDESDNKTVVSEEQQEKNQHFFDIVQMINDGKYDEATTNIQTYYGYYDYLGTDGFNKANLQRMLYHNQEKWDEEMQMKGLETNFKMGKRMSLT